MIRLHTKQHVNWTGLTSAILLFGMLAGCTLAPTTPAPSPIPSPTPLATATLATDDQGLSADEIATLSSLTQLDDFPLYTLKFTGAYPPPILTAVNTRLVKNTDLAAPNACQAGWGCSLFAALGDPTSRFYGRNFDWRFSPALLLFTNPPDGYASVSLVDIEYLGFESTWAIGLTSLPLEKRRGLLDAPALPFDGMNERGLAIGMASVPPGKMHPDPNKKTIDQLVVMREILDHAATIDEAVNILAAYNIDMGNVPLHYLVASAAGDAALVEFYQGKMVVFRNKDPWLHATNFLVASTGGQPQGQCPRYDRISQRLQETGGRLTTQDVLSLLAGVALDGPYTESTTQWSVVYDLTGGSVNIVMGRKYKGEVHRLHLSMNGK